MTQEQAILRGEMARPGFQLIMTRLQEHAEDLQREYDTVNFAIDPGRAMHIQITRDVIQNGVPRIIEGIMNADQPETRWTFKGWLRTILGERQ